AINKEEKEKILNQTGLFFDIFNSFHLKILSQFYQKSYHFLRTSL
ncbi:hypothetical protein M153_43780003, partial [Pseudoloma neurophilia]